MSQTKAEGETTCSIKLEITGTVSLHSLHMLQSIT